MSLPGQQASHLQSMESQPGHSVEHWLVVGRRSGGSQNPTAAKQSHAVLSFGQQLGHLAPGVYTGCVPSLQKLSSAKHSQVWSGVCETLRPGQQASHLQSMESQPGHSGLWFQPSMWDVHWLTVGNRSGGSQKPIAAKHAHAVFSFGQHCGHSAPSSHLGTSPSLQKPSLAKHAQVLSGVSETLCPGQHESPQLHGVVHGGFVVHDGQTCWHRDSVGSFFFPGKC